MKTDQNVAARIHWIDFLRGLAVLAVVLTHFSQKIAPDGAFLREWIPKFLHTAIFKSGYYGVVVFFVISGFLITSTSLKRWKRIEKVQPGKFYLFRFARIAPNLIMLILILSALHLIGISDFLIDTEKSSLGRTIIAALTFHINWLEAFSGGLTLSWGILWSLAVEEIFYLFFPIVCLLSKRNLNFGTFLVVLILLGPFARTILTDNQSWRDHGYLSGMDGIAFGCMAALLSSYHRFSEGVLLICKWMGITLVVSSFLFNGLIYNIGLGKFGLNVSLLEFGTAMLLIYIYDQYKKGKNQVPKLAAPLCWYGRNSYEIYLTHLFVVLFLYQHFSVQVVGTAIAIIGFLIVVVLSGILGHWVTTWFSEPLNHRIRKSWGR